MTSICPLRRRIRPPPVPRNRPVSCGRPAKVNPVRHHRMPGDRRRIRLPHPDVRTPIPAGGRRASAGVQLRPAAARAGGVRGRVEADQRAKQIDKLPLRPPRSRRTPDAPRASAPSRLRNRVRHSNRVASLLVGRGGCNREFRHDRSDPRPRGTRSARRSPGRHATNWVWCDSRSWSTATRARSHGHSRRSTKMATSSATRHTRLPPRLAGVRPGRKRRRHPTPGRGSAHSPAARRNPRRKRPPLRRAR